MQDLMLSFPFGQRDDRSLMCISVHVDDVSYGRFRRYLMVLFHLSFQCFLILFFVLSLPYTPGCIND